MAHSVTALCRDVVPMPFGNAVAIGDTAAVADAAAIGDMAPFGDGVLL